MAQWELAKTALSSALNIMPRFSLTLAKIREIIKSAWRQIESRRLGAHCRSRQVRLWPIKEKPLVIAHRGGGHEALENSLYAFRVTAERGFRFIETDAQATSDGVVVLFHDSVLERTTNGFGKISGYTWDQLSQVRDHSGNSLVRLDTALAEFPHVIFNIDAKGWNVVEPLIVTIRKAGKQAREQVCLASFSETRLQRLRAQLPGFASSLGTGAIAALVIASRLPKGISRIIAKIAVPDAGRGVQAVQVPQRQGPIRVITPIFVELCHSLGLAVHAWTINRESDMRALLALGIDGIITDKPSRARAVIDDWWAGR